MAAVLFFAVFLAAVFLAALFLIFRVPIGFDFFLAVVAADFFAADFFAADFFAADFLAVVFRAAVFRAAVFFAGDFLLVVRFAAFRAVDAFFRTMQVPPFWTDDARCSV